MMKVIVHCSDSTFGNAVMIDIWHAERGFRNTDGIHIGYHYVILNGQLTSKKYNKYIDGVVETGRALDDDDKFEYDERAAATLGHNDAVQICLIGKSGLFTSVQIMNLRFKIKQLREQFGKIEVHQHSDFANNKPYCAGLSLELMKEFNIVDIH